MYRKIYKFALEITDKQTISFQGKRPKILSVAEQNGKLMLWAQAGIPEGIESTHEIKVEVIGTGNPFETDLPFIGTVVMSTSSAVWHIYAEVSP